MHPQMTNIQASAQDAFEHIFASAGALVFVNEYSGSAAPPAPYNAFAEHKLACPLTPLYHTLGEHTCSKKRPKTFAAFVGLDWADAKHDVCLQAAGSEQREHDSLDHTPEAIEAWGCSLHKRFAGKPIAICLELNKGPIVFALRKYHFLVLFPVQPPDPRPVPRSVYPQPREG